MRHVTYGWGRSRMNEACHVWMRQVKYERGMSHATLCRSTSEQRGKITHAWVMSHMDEACQIWIRHVTPAIVPVHWWAEGPWRRMRVFRLLSAAPVNESCHTWMNESWVMRHVIHVNASWVTFEWVMSDIWMKHESFVKESWVTYSMLRGCVSCSLAQFGTYEGVMSYGVATISRLLKIIGLFCRISSLSQGSFKKETYNFKESM